MSLSFHFSPLPVSISQCSVAIWKREDWKEINAGSGLTVAQNSNSDLNCIKMELECIFFKQSMHQSMTCALEKIDLMSCSMFTSFLLQIASVKSTFQRKLCCLSPKVYIFVDVFPFAPDYVWAMQLCAFVFRVYFSLLCVFMRLWEGGKRPCEQSPTEGKVEQWSTREWDGAWVISAPAAHAQRWGRIKVCECIQACLPGSILFNYFIPPLVYSGASSMWVHPSASTADVRASACVSVDRPLGRGPPASSGICTLSRHESPHVPSQTTPQQQPGHTITVRKHAFPSRYCAFSRRLLMTH